MPALQRDSSHPKLNRLIDWPAAGRVESMLTRVRNAFFEQRKLCRLFENGAAIVRHPAPRPLPQSRRVIDPCCCKLPSHRPIPCYYAVHGVAAYAIRITPGARIFLALLRRLHVAKAIVFRIRNGFVKRPEKLF